MTCFNRKTLGKTIKKIKFVIYFAVKNFRYKWIFFTLSYVETQFLSEDYTANEETRKN